MGVPRSTIQSSWARRLVLKPMVTTKWDSPFQEIAIDIAIDIRSSPVFSYWIYPELQCFVSGFSWWRRRPWTVATVCFLTSMYVNASHFATSWMNVFGSLDDEQFQPPFSSHIMLPLSCLPNCVWRSVDSVPESTIQGRSGAVLLNPTLTTINHH